MGWQGARKQHQLDRLAECHSGAVDVKQRHFKGVAVEIAADEVAGAGQGAVGNLAYRELGVGRECAGWHHHADALAGHVEGAAGAGVNALPEQGGVVVAVAAGNQGGGYAKGEDGVAKNNRLEIHGILLSWCGAVWRIRCRSPMIAWSS